jgi:hypothetical protein
MLERIEPSVDRGGGQLRLALLLDEGLDVPPGHRLGGFVEWRKKQAHIAAIMLDGVGRIVPGMQIDPKLVHGGRFHPYLPLRACRCVICAMACSYWCFLVVLESCAYRRVSCIE